jgi:hypothetical protein
MATSIVRHQSRKLMPISIKRFNGYKEAHGKDMNGKSRIIPAYTDLF